MIEEIQELGTFNFESRIPDGEGMRVLKRFLKKLTYEIAYNVAKQINSSDYPPSFAYREKQIHTVIAPAMDKISDNFLMESPVNRNWSLSNEDMNDAHGWVDYWCEYCNYSYYIELKHGFKAYKSKILRSKIKEDWEVAYRQLDSLTDEINLEKSYTKGVFKILIHAIPIYQNSSKPNTEKSVELGNMIEHQNQAMEEISVQIPSNWSSLWILKNEMYKEYSFINGYEKYPGLLLLMNISELVK